MKENSKAIVISIDDMQEILQDLSDAEIGVIIRALICGREPEVEDRTIRIVYKQLRAANDRFAAAYEAKRERFKRAAEARWQKAEHQNSNIATQCNAMQRNATQLNAMVYHTKPNQTEPNRTKPNHVCDIAHTPQEETKNNIDWRAYWNERANTDIPHIVMTNQRKDRLKNLEEKFGVASIKIVIDYVTANKRLKKKTGKNNFRATFDWVFGEQFIPLLEEALTENKTAMAHRAEESSPHIETISQKDRFLEYIKVAEKPNAPESVLNVLAQAKANGTLERLGLKWESDNNRASHP